MRTLRYSLSSLLVLHTLSSCGRVGGGDNADAATDGPPTDGAATGVTVTVQTLQSDGMPQVGAVVSFNDSELKVVGSDITPYDGKVSSARSSVNSVTVAWVTPGAVRLLTIAGVETGDNLVVGTPELRQDVTTTTKVKFTAAPVANTGHTVYTRCNPDGIAVPATTGPIEVVAKFKRYCDSPDQYDFLAVATATPVVAAKTEDQAKATDITIPASWPRVDEITAAYDNIPSQVVQAQTTRSLRSHGAALQNVQSALVNVTTATLNIPVARGVAAGDDAVFRTEVITASPIRQSQSVYDVTTTGNRYALNVGDNLLPWIGDAAIAPDKPVVAWKRDGTKDGDVTVVELSYTRTTPEGGVNVSWRVLAPGNVSSVTLPNLPSELGDIGLRTGDAAFLGPVQLIDVQDKTYKDLRPRIDIDFGTLAGGGSGATKTVVSKFECVKDQCPRKTQ